MLTKQLKPNKQNEHILKQFMDDFEKSGLNNAVDYLGSLIDGVPKTPPLDVAVVAQLTETIARLTETIASQQQTIASQEQYIVELTTQKTIADQPHAINNVIAFDESEFEEESLVSQVDVVHPREELVTTQKIIAAEFKEKYKLSDKLYATACNSARHSYYVAPDGTRWCIKGKGKHAMWSPFSELAKIA